MKKFILLLFVSTLCISAFAQNEEKYMAAMQPKVAAVDTVRKPEDLIALSASFERIADAEKTKWLPYYYAALTQVQAAYFLGDNLKADKSDPMADKADGLLKKAEALSSNNSEIYVVKKMIASLRLMADPMTRWQQYGPIAEEALQTAIKLNPENPRVYLLQAQDKYFIPEQFGGSKTEAKTLFETAIKKYETFKPATSIDPTWGRPSVQYFLGELNK